ncbi:LysR family transcriptional regulator [Spirillospora sp. NPDC049652]
MDLDLAQVRAFVTTVDTRHFGHAAAELGLTQQALSKRIARLETLLGTRLLERGHGGVEPTAAGHRFLAPARRALATADAAVSAVRDDAGPLRVDVWGHLYDPSRTLSEVIDDVPPIELGRARDLPAVFSALLRGEADAAFGRVHRTGQPREDELTRRVVRLEPVDALISEDHPLGRAEQLRPADLRDARLVFPAAADRLDFLRHFADAFGVRDRVEVVNLGAGRLLAELRDTPGAFTLFPADARLPDVPGVRAVPLADPVPLYAWSLLWADATRHPRLSDLLRALSTHGRAHRWLEYDPSRDWLPDEDADALSRP